jgi:deferrochelatase/peroxidase EfeB
MAGGSYLVSRRIRMTIEVWDRAALQEQEAVMGRAKRTGAPLGAAVERDEPDFAATTSDGSLAIPATAHVRLAHPAQNGGAHLLRRGYNFTDGIDHLGRLDAGLFFLAYQRDPRRQFVPIQTRLAESDHLSEYLQHVSSGVYACPPGVGPHTFWGSTLFV